MTNEEKRFYLNQAAALMDKLPEGGEVIDISLSSPYIQVQGDFDFRAFAEAEGCKAVSYLFDSDTDDEFIEMKAFGLLGCTVIYILFLGEPLYKRELQRCEKL